jgi:hypothetical protein
MSRCNQSGSSASDYPARHWYSGYGGATQGGEVAGIDAIVAFIGAPGSCAGPLPGCAQFLPISLAGIAKWTQEDFAKVWAQHRASRSVLAEFRIRSAMNHLEVSSHAAARSDLEYVRDHFDCGIPYLHQMIGLLAGMQQDEPAKASAMERLKEFGPQFGAPLDFSPQLMATATMGMMANFGMVPPGTGPK